MNSLPFSPDKAFQAYEIFTEVHFIYKKVCNYEL